MTQEVFFKLDWFSLSIQLHDSVLLLLLNLHIKGHRAHCSLPTTQLFPSCSPSSLVYAPTSIVVGCLLHSWLSQIKFLWINSEFNQAQRHYHGQRQATLQRKTHIRVVSRLLVDGLYYALMTGLKRSLCHSRSAAGKSRSSCDMAKRKMSSAGRSWMVALILLCNLSKVKPKKKRKEWKISSVSKIRRCFQQEEWITASSGPCVIRSGKEKSNPVLFLLADQAHYWLHSPVNWLHAMKSKYEVETGGEWVGCDQGFIAGGSPWFNLKWTGSCQAPAQQFNRVWSINKDR